VIEEPVLVVGNRIALGSFGDIVIVNGDNVDSTVGLSGDKETVRYYDRALGVSKDITRNDFDVIRPLKLSFVLTREELEGLQLANSVVYNTCFNSRSDVDCA